MEISDDYKVEIMGSDAFRKVSKELKNTLIKDIFLYTFWSVFTGYFIYDFIMSIYINMKTDFTLGMFVDILGKCVESSGKLGKIFSVIIQVLYLFFKEISPEVVAGLCFVGFAGLIFLEGFFIYQLIGRIKALSDYKNILLNSVVEFLPDNENPSIK